MSREVFDTLLRDLKSACVNAASKPFPLEAVFRVAQAAAGSRERIVRELKVGEGELPIELLTVIDVVSVASSLEVARHDQRKGGEPVAAEIVDLWIRATAARALWFERFVLWPTENSSKKLEHLIDTAKTLGVDSIARELLLGGQPSHFASFVGGLRHV